MHTSLYAVVGAFFQQSIEALPFITKGIISTKVTYLWDILEPDGHHIACKLLVHKVTSYFDRFTQKIFMKKKLRGIC